MAKTLNEMKSDTKMSHTKVGDGHRAGLGGG